jgi:hypothetical protein
VRCQKPEELAIGFTLVFVNLLVVCRRRRRVVNVARQSHLEAILIDQANWMVFVPALPTEVHAVEALLGLAGQELLPLNCNDAVPWLLERGVRVAGTGNELVQLEREEPSFVSSNCTHAEPPPAHSR